jgi:serine/threonine protein kinase
LLPSSFSPPSAGVVKEFFVPASGGGSTGDFRVTFTPDGGSAAFVNAVELFSAPPELLWNRSVTPVGAAAGSDNNVSLWQQQALETAYRLNVGGPPVTTQNDTLWRTWIPDAPFLFGPPGLSVVNSTTSPIAYDSSEYVTREVAPDAVYKTQRATNASASVSQGPVNVTWTFPAEARADYLVRLHFCDYEMLSSVVDVGIVFNVFVAGDLGYRDLAPTKLPSVTVSNQPFYLDFVAATAAGNNITVSIGMSEKSSPGEGGFLNGLEIMKLLGPWDSSLARGGASSSGSKKRAVIITVAVLLVLAACAVLCCLLLVRRRKSQRPAPEESKGSTQDGGGGSSSWVAATSRGPGAGGTANSSGGARTQLHIPLAEITAATDGFHERNLVGVGGFGNVYRGVLRDGTRVAVKRAMRATKQGLPEFQTEIVVLSAIRHRHLVSLIGYCNDKSEMILAYEYMEKGTLRSHLYGGGSTTPLSWKQRLEICIGAARGLHYLHTGYSENIIHRDVKSTNILLGDGLIAKVADFGLSRMGPSFGETHVSTAVKGSFGYLDPEYFKTQQLTDRSDVYSFGVVLLEVLCARPVIDQQAPELDQINLAEWALKWHQKGRLHSIADPRIAGPQVNENSLRKFAETAAKCLADYGVDRPSMGDVLWNLEYCLQLQETHVRREAFEDSGAAATQFPEDVVVPRWMPSSTVDDDTVTDSKVFSQLISGDGR